MSLPRYKSPQGALVTALVHADGSASVRPVGVTGQRQRQIELDAATFVHFALVDAGPEPVDPTYPRVLRTHPLPGRGAQVPGAVVLRDLGADRHDRYATHIRVDHPDREPYFISGDYFADRLDAEVNFSRRVERER